MIEHKYRLWDAPNKRMMDLEDMAWPVDLIEQHLHVEYESPVEEPHLHPWTLMMDLIEENGGVLLQCTGLKDKNGVEIFEGDVVRMYDNPANTGLVVWFGSGWHVETSPDDIITLNVMSEVIGNIYENKELLG